MNLDEKCLTKARELLEPINPVSVVPLKTVQKPNNKILRNSKHHEST